MKFSYCQYGKLLSKDGYALFIKVFGKVWEYTHKKLEPEDIFKLVRKIEKVKEINQLSSAWTGTTATYVDGGWKYGSDMLDWAWYMKGWLEDIGLDSKGE
jgi:hypothetical protein